MICGSELESCILRAVRYCVQLLCLEIACVGAFAAQRKRFAPIRRLQY